MAGIECDNEILVNLPRGEVSAEMYVIDEEPLPKKAKKSNAEEPTPVSLDQFNTVSDEFCDGSSLLRSREEDENVVPLSSTITVGATQTTDVNIHEMASNLLQSNSGASLSLRTAVASDGTVQASADEANTFVVRPSTVFASESDEDYLEKHYPDLFPFGRGGFGEKRKYRISRKAYLSYLLNLSTCQFQHVDFLLPLYDMTTRQEVASKAFIRSKLPSRENSLEGAVSKGELFGRISTRALKKVGEFQKACAEAAARGVRLLLAPSDVDGVSLEFFNSINISNQPMQHSQAAAMRNRQDVYAAHNILGPAQIWFTVSPDDTKTLKIVYYALGPEKSLAHERITLSEEFRFNLLADCTVAAAHNFENILHDIVEHIVGWCKKTGQPKKLGGLFGICKAYLRVNEEQSRLTLHVHFLIWMYGHVNLKEQLQEAINKDFFNAERIELIPEENCEATVRPSSIAELLTTENESEESHLKSILEKLERNLDSYSVGELQLPAPEMQMLTACNNPDCIGQRELIDQEMLTKMRSRPTKDEGELEALQCSVCNIKSTCSDRIQMAFEHGYMRCNKKSKPNKQQILDLMWVGLRPKPQIEDTHQLDCWILDVAVIHDLVNIHDWRHRASCLKIRQEQCRYHCPHGESTTHATTEYNEKIPDKANESSPKEIIKINLQIQRRAIFMFLTDCNLAVLAVLKCNNCTRYVLNQLISMYYGCYTTKHTKENEKALVELFRALNAYEDKLNAAKARSNPEEMNGSNSSATTERSDWSIGYSRLLVATRASTNGETIGAPLAAFLARGNHLFQMSHETAPLLLQQALAFLNGSHLNASINKNGIIMAAVFDYVYRTTDGPSFSLMNMWVFVATQ